MSVFILASLYLLQHYLALAVQLWVCFYSSFHKLFLVVFIHDDVVYVLVVSLAGSWKDGPVNLLSWPLFLQLTIHSRL